jgi:hypothetical protein
MRNCPSCESLRDHERKIDRKINDDKAAKIAGSEEAPKRSHAKIVAYSASRWIRPHVLTHFPANPSVDTAGPATAPPIDHEGLLFCRVFAFIRLKGFRGKSSLWELS